MGCVSDSRGATHCCCFCVWSEFVRPARPQDRPRVEKLSRLAATLNSTDDFSGYDDSSSSQAAFVHVQR